MTHTPQLTSAKPAADLDPIVENGRELGLGENSIRVLQTRYLKKGPDGQCVETPHEMFTRVAVAVAAAEANYGASPEKVKEIEKAYYDVMVKGLYMPNSPTLMNAGREMGMLSACFVLPFGDSIDEIFDTVKHTAMIQKAGGGTGFSFDRLRPSGDWIKSSGGTTSGPISFWKVLSEATNAIQQGAFRRGANMGMMQCLCGDVLVHTLDAGLVPIRELVGKRPYVYACNPETRKVHVVQADSVFVSGTNRETVRVHLDDDRHVDCTPDHRFMLSTGGYTTAGELKTGDSLMAFKHRMQQHGKAARFVRTLACAGGIAAYEHAVVARDILGVQVSQNDSNIYHDDENSLNNMPSNLVSVSRSEHGKLHSGNLRGHQQRIADARRGKRLEDVYPEEKVARWKSNMSKAAKNHKVLKVEKLGVTAEVYDISLPVLHNFAAEGVFVHNCDHPDVIKFIHAKQDKTCFQNYNISVKVTDEWMEAHRKRPNDPLVVTNKRSGKQYVIPVEFANPKTTISNYELKDLILLETYVGLKKQPAVWTMKRIWDTIIQNAWLTGEPGVVFIDRINQFNPTPNVGEMEATNPCVPAGTRLLTQDGYQAIEALVGQKAAVWNGKQWSEVEPRVTGHDQPLTRVSFSDGTELACTDAHKFVLADGERVSAIELKPGDTLSKFGMPVVEGGEKLAFDAYTHGFFCGDGQDNGHSRGILLYGAKELLAPFIKGNLGQVDGERKRTYVGLGSHFPAKTYVPVNASLKDRLNWLAGLLDADGNTTENPNSVALCLSANGLKFLREVRLLLTTLGVQAKINEAREAGPRELPDGNGGTKTYWCEKQYRLLINAADTAKLVSLGLHVRRLAIRKVEPNRDARRFVEVVSTEPAGCAETVYCFTEPLNHTGTFEGIVTGQCGEQPLLPYEACNLGSINLGAFVGENKLVNWGGLKKVVHLATRFLENVVEINNYQIPQIAKVCSENRKIGLGIMGFADALFKLGVGYNTDEGVAWGEKFMKFVNDEAHDESERLAEERGVFKNWHGSRWELEWKRKQRNACSTTVAPTGTISIIANCSGGLEPLFSLAFERHVLKDSKGTAQKMTEVNPIFEAVAKAQDFWGYGRDALIDRICTEGTLHNIPNIPDEVKRVFVCTHDIAPERHVYMQAAFQKHCDSSISKTTNFPHDAKPEDVRVIYELAYDSGCKGVTVYRDRCRDEQAMALKTVVKPVVKAEREPLKPVKTPTILSAVRLRYRTPFGNMHMTISMDPKTEHEMEVFAQIGKAGDISSSDMEAICRMISLWLRAGGTLDTVVEQLDGIGSHMTMASKDGQVMSLGDALAKALRRYLTAKNLHGLKAILLGEVDLDKMPGSLEAVASIRMVDDVRTSMKLKCPSCQVGTLIFQESCHKCTSCDYSKC